MKLFCASPVFFWVLCWGSQMVSWSAFPGFDSWLAADYRNLTCRSTFIDDYAYSLPLLEGGFHFYFCSCLISLKRILKSDFHGLKCGAITGRDIDCFRQHPVEACHDRIVVSSLCCGRINPCSNPGHGRHSDKCFFEAYLQYCLWKRCTVVYLFRIIYFFLICFTGFIVLLCCSLPIYSWNDVLFFQPSGSSLKVWELDSPIFLYFSSLML